MGVWVFFLPSPHVCGDKDKEPVGVNKDHNAADAVEIDESAPALEPVAAERGGQFYVTFAALFFYYFCYAGGEMTPGDWLTTASTESLGVTLEQGVTLTTVFWVSLTVGRLAGVPLGLWLSLHALTTLSLVLAAVSSGLLVASFEKKWLAGVYASVVGIALGFASLYPAGVILAQNKFQLGPKWISRCIVGNTLVVILSVQLSGVYLCLYV